MRCGIYGIINKVNGKRYVGSSKEIEKRWDRHLRELRAVNHHNIVLQRAWNKYGEQSFVFELLETCSEGDLLQKEQAVFDTTSRELLYNIGLRASGGDNFTNNPNREQIIDKMTKNLSERIASLTKQERKNKWGRPGNSNPNWQGGLYEQYHTCPKCGRWKGGTGDLCIDCFDKSGENNPFFGKHHTPETIDKIKKAKYDNPQPLNAGNYAPRKVMVDGIEYKTVTAAAKANGCSNGTVVFRCKSKNFKSWNYI